MALRAHSVWSEKIYLSINSTESRQTEPCHVKPLYAYGDSEDLDQPAQLRRLIRVFAVYLQNFYTVENIDV